MFVGNISFQLGWSIASNGGPVKTDINAWKKYALRAMYTVTVVMEFDQRCDSTFDVVRLLHSKFAVKSENHKISLHQSYNIRL